MPVDVPIVQTDLEIKPVRIGAWADIGTNAVILPGVTHRQGRDRRRRRGRDQRCAGVRGRRRRARRSSCAGGRDAELAQRTRRRRSDEP